MDATLTQQEADILRGLLDVRLEELANCEITNWRDKIQHMRAVRLAYLAKESGSPRGAVRRAKRGLDIAFNLLIKYH